MPQQTRRQDDPVISNGVGLRRSEWEKLESFGEKIDMTRNGVTAYAVRYFLQELEAGRVELETKVVFRPIKKKP